MPKADTPSPTTYGFPSRFDGDFPVLDWQDEWRIEDYQLELHQAPQSA